MCDMRVVRRVICIAMILCVMFSFCACEQEDTSFCAKSSNVVGDAGKGEVISAEIKAEVLDISEHNIVSVKMGFGGRKKNTLDGTENTWVSIEGQGCIINGQSDKYEKKYDDFHTNDIYRHSEKERLWGLTYPDLIPNYFEDVEVIFPEGECVGELIFRFNDLLPNGSVDYATVSIYYAKTDTIIVFSAEADYDAERKLEALMSTE